jgi:hypothetical protein
MQPPLPVSPAWNEPTGLRPTLTVRNVPRFSKDGRLMMYRFEVATDTDFTTTIAGAAVAETPAQTSLEIGTDLPPERTLFWRAIAIDTVSGASRVGDASPFVTHRPGGGSYTLVIRVADSCSALIKRDFTFDGHLSVRGDAVQFTLAPTSSIPYRAANTGNLRLEFRQNGSRIDGTLATDFSADRDGYFVAAYERQTNHFPVFVNGSSSGSGRWSGVFDGFMHVLHPSFGLATVVCVAPHFTWSLAVSVP